MPLRPEYQISNPDRASHFSLPGSSHTGSAPADVSSYTLPLFLLEGKKKSWIFRPCTSQKVCNLIRHESYIHIVAAMTPAP
jgi:hypothetical protein